MAHLNEFVFSRARGVVWVCDVVGSSSRLNSDNGVEDTESFLPRLYWIAAVAVESAGGKFIKWTGDGFLAWFETSLHRDLEKTVRRCLEAVWHLTVLVNVTQLDVNPKRKFKLRHGVTYEQDALCTEIIHPDKSKTLDLMGRAVVLAFRLSGIASDFPGIVTHRDVAEIADHRLAGTLRIWKPTAEEVLKHFKGEKRGTNSLYVSGEKKPRKVSQKNVLNIVKVAIRKAENVSASSDVSTEFTGAFCRALIAGPKWSRRVADEYTRFVGEDLLQALKTIVVALEKPS